MLKQDDTKAQSRIKVAPKQMVQVHYKNFGAKTAVRCGWISGRYNCQSHIHQYAELVYVAEGEMTVTVDSVSRVMRSGDFAIIAPFRIHSFSTPESVRRWVCVFSDDFIRHLVTEDELYGLSTNFTFTASAGLVEYAAPMMLEAGERFINLDAMLIRRFKALITAVYEEYMRNAGEVRSEQRRNALSAILTYIAAHYREQISLASIGAALGYSPKYVSSCLSQIEEMNLFRLVNSFRASYAKQLLKNTNFKVIDIAYECGYTCEKSFHRAFLQVTGVTPGKYRRLRQTQGMVNGSENFADMHLERIIKKKKQLSI